MASHLKKEFYSNVGGDEGAKAHECLRNVLRGSSTRHAKVTPTLTQPLANSFIVPHPQQISTRDRVGVEDDSWKELGRVGLRRIRCSVAELVD